MIRIIFPNGSVVNRRGKAAQTIYYDIVKKGTGFGMWRRIEGGWQRRHQLPGKFRTAKAIEKAFPIKKRQRET